MEKVGEIETLEDFANEECTASDEKLQVAKKYA